jgi:hypothetical protein
MYLDPQSSLALYKVNLKFYFRLCDLVRENLLRWSDAGNRALNTCAADLETAATRLLDAGDWHAMGFVAGDLYWKALQSQTSAMQHMTETIVGSQSSFASALQETVSTWQKESAEALKETTGAMPVSTTLQDFLQNYLHVLTPLPGRTVSAPSSRRLH